MSTLELSKDGVKMPVWILGVLGVMFLGWNGFITKVLIDTNNALARLETKFEADVVTPGVQRELSLIRERINAQDVAIGTNTRAGIENASDLRNLRSDFEHFRKP